MEPSIFESQTYTGTDFTAPGLERGEYEDCNFTNCNLEAVNLAGIRFTGCVFTECNMTMVKLHKTAFREVSFVNCKLLGLHFNDCHDIGFSVSFTDCILNLSSFYQRKCKGICFENTSLTEVDFAEADLSSAVFEKCNLLGANFEHTLLEKADFRTAYNYSINPDTNRIKKAKFSLTGLPGLLDRYDIDIS